MRGFGAEGRDKPDGCYAVLAGGEDWKRRVRDYRRREGAGERVGMGAGG